MWKDNRHPCKLFAEVEAELEAAGRFYLKHLACYPNVRLYEGAWKEYA